MDVFISYSSLDRTIARRVAEIFRSRGFKVWIDEGELGPGDSLASALSTAISNVGIFVAILTNNSVQSGWVKYELNMAVSRVIAKGAKILPLLFDDSPLPQILEGMIWGDCRTSEGMVRAIDQALKSIGVKIPMPPESIEHRYRAREGVSYGIRLIPKPDFNAEGSLGKQERKYVFIGDYAEQCGRSLRQVLSNLWFGDAFDKVSKANHEWVAIIFEVGASNQRKLDLLPGTWKAIYRIFSDKRRLGLITPSEEVTQQMGKQPRDYYEGNQAYWYYRIDEGFSQVNKEYRYYEQALSDYIGVDWLCFQGDGITYSTVWVGTATNIPSRIFLVKNVSLESLNYRVQELGSPDDGVIVI